MSRSVRHKVLVTRRLAESLCEQWLPSVREFLALPMAGRAARLGRYVGIRRNIEQDLKFREVGRLLIVGRENLKDISKAFFECRTVDASSSDLDFELTPGIFDHSAH